MGIEGTRLNMIKVIYDKPIAKKAVMCLIKEIQLLDKLCSGMSYNAVGSGFVVYGLYYVEVGSLYAHFLESFYQKWVLNFVKCFFCVY